MLPIHHEAERLPFPSSGGKVVQRAESAPPCVAEEKRMNPVERPPAIVRWTLRLEDATALDAAVQAVEPTIRSVFGTGARAAVLRGDWLGHAVHPTCGASIGPDAQFCGPTQRQRIVP